MDRLDNAQIDAAGLADWRKLAQAIRARFLADDLGAAVSFVTVVGETLGSDADHLELHLGIDGGRAVIDLTLCTRVDGRWVTATDLDLARRISDLATDHGLDRDPAAATQVELGLDTVDDDAIAPFWAALLTGSVDNRIYDSIFDPTDRAPAVWFQGTDDASVPRQRWHLDVWVAPESATQRIAAALAAGGRVVEDSGAPTYTVLADPQGNRACVCTSIGR